MPVLLTVAGFVASIGGDDRIRACIGADDPDEVLTPKLLAAEAEIESEIGPVGYPSTAWTAMPEATKELIRTWGYAMVGAALAPRMPDLPEGMKDADKAARARLAAIRAGRASLPGMARIGRTAPRILTSGTRTDGAAVPGALFDHLRTGGA